MSSEVGLWNIEFGMSQQRKHSEEDHCKPVMFSSSQMIIIRKH